MPGQKQKAQLEVIGTYLSEVADGSYDQSKFKINTYSDTPVSAILIYLRNLTDIF